MSRIRYAECLGSYWANGRVRFTRTYITFIGMIVLGTLTDTSGGWYTQKYGI